MVVVSKPLLHQARDGRLVSCCSSLSTEGPPASTTSMPMTLRTARWRRPRRSPNPVSERSRNCARWCWPMASCMSPMVPSRVAPSSPTHCRVPERRAPAPCSPARRR
jgi:hypothetical protein